MVAETAPAPYWIDMVWVEPTKAMPKDMYMELARLSMFAELMRQELMLDGTVRVLWDETVTTEYSPTFFEAEWLGLQRDWFVMPMLVRRDLVDPHSQAALGHGTQGKDTAEPPGGGSTVAPGTEMRQ